MIIDCIADLHGFFSKLDGEVLKFSLDDAKETVKALQKLIEEIDE